MARNPQNTTGSVKKTDDEGGWQWSYTIIILGLFGGIASMVYLGNLTLVPVWWLLVGWLGIGAIACLVPLSFYRKFTPMNRVEWQMFNFIGLAGVLSSVLLWLNFLVPVSTTVTVHQVVNQKVDVGDEIVFEFEDGFLREHKGARSFYVSIENIGTMALTEEVEYTVGTGLLGLDVVLDRECR